MLETLKTPGDSSWFTHDRFGLFIHWGLYSLPARHEWVKSYEKTPEAQYDRYFQHFEPDLYDPQAWADAASDAGMKYFVITTKHHEGFCLWDSALTKFKATEAPNCRRDLLRPMVDAFRARNMRVGFYHSLLDWHHPDYVVDLANHPRRDDDIEALNQGRRQERYAKYLRDQVRELLTQFGQIDVLWFDFSFHKDPTKPRDDFRFNKGREAWQSEELYRVIRELQPKVLLTDRLDLDMPLSGGDFKTPEQAQPRQWVTMTIDGKVVPVVWEACQTFSGSWGYFRDEMTWRDSTQLVQTLVDCVSKGGNLLLNVGPTGRGELDPRALTRLRDIGKWVRHHSRSIYGCTQAPAEFKTPQDCRLTYNPIKKRLYLHLLAWPYKMVHLEGEAFTSRVQYAQLLHDASELKMGVEASWHAGQISLDPHTLTLNLPQHRPEVLMPVVELFLK